MEQPLAIVLDVDGTILDSAHRMSRRTWHALRRCADRGILLYVATARPIRLVLREREVPGDASFLTGRGAFYNGATAMDRELGCCRHWDMPADLVEEVTACLAASAPQAQLAIQAREEYHSYMLPMDEAILGDWGFPPGDRIPWDEARTRPCSKMVAWSRTEGLAEVRRLLALRFADRLNLFLTDSGRWLQITAAEATKAVAISELLALRRIPPSRVLAFGDDLPDVSMFKAFGCSAAMGQAAQAVKEMATFVTATNDEDGVALALERLVRARGEADAMG